ncbi:hypothetical protein [Streptomyces sp. NBC_00212]|uniref:hypothetical protein n=1 Tax=Streptomyces sp. NBC_00212 TaxID=2975684 RepID=UPI00386D1A6F
MPGPLLDRADLHQVGERNRQGGDAYDPGLADQHREFALRCDLVFFSAAAAGDNTPALMREILREGRADTVVATAGAEGSCLLTRDGRFGALAGTHACTAPVATEPISRKSLLAAYQIA